jgi:hypothetical protein
MRSRKTNIAVVAGFALAVICAPGCLERPVLKALDTVVDATADADVAPLDTKAESHAPDLATQDSAADTPPDLALPDLADELMPDTQLYDIPDDGQATDTDDLVEETAITDAGSELDSQPAPLCPQAPECADGEPCCQDYCAKMTSYCWGDNAQFASHEECLCFCTTWGQLPLGEFADRWVNTVGCRTYWADQAGLHPEDPSNYCKYASASGGYGCGYWCDNYCYFETLNCDHLYPSQEGCTAQCSYFPADANVTAISGNSVQCRLYHMWQAGNPTKDQDAECTAASPSGGDICVN